MFIDIPIAVIIDAVAFLIGIGGYCIAAIVAVLGAPRSGLATAEPLRVSELIGLLLVVVVLVREVV